MVRSYSGTTWYSDAGLSSHTTPLAPDESSLKQHTQILSQPSLWRTWAVSGSTSALIAALTVAQRILDQCTHTTTALATGKDTMKEKHDDTSSFARPPTTASHVGNGTCADIISLSTLWTKWLVSGKDQLDPHLNAMSVRQRRRRKRRRRRRKRRHR